MGMKLLLADESIAVRKAVQIVFRMSDTEVAFAGNSEELVSITKSLKPDIALVSTSLPGLNLKTDIQSLTGNNQNRLPVVLLADRDAQLTHTSSKKLGAAGLLIKPLDDREMKNMLDQILNAPEPDVEKMDTQTHDAVDVEPSTDSFDESLISAASELTTPSLKEATIGSPEQRAQILMEILESYLNENSILLTDSLAVNLAPKLAPEVAGKIIESIDFSDLSFKIATIVEGVIQDLVPQLAENLITQEIDKIKEEAVRLINSEEEDSE
jgi:DNA-binding response OmpR family regulator